MADKGWRHPVRPRGSGTCAKYWRRSRAGVDIRKLAPSKNSHPSQTRLHSMHTRQVGFLTNPAGWWQITFAGRITAICCQTALSIIFSGVHEIADGWNHVSVAYLHGRDRLYFRSPQESHSRLFGPFLNTESTRTTHEFDPAFLRLKPILRRACS